MHGYVVRRFRRYAGDINKEQKKDILWLTARRKDAMKGLSVLRRANEGYSKPLERVLRLSYGRLGKRRKQLVATIVTPDVPSDNLVVEELVKKPAMFEDGWQPPTMVVDLLKSQNKQYAVERLGVLNRVRHHEPNIPSENAWGKPVAQSRRRNIRKRWYANVLDNLFPPLPDNELRVLEGLISGEIPWAAIKRRKAIDSPSPPSEGLAKFLAEGPQKGHTFEPYTAGRPHKITHRFMRRLWQRISCLVPRIGWNEATQKRRIQWGTMRSGGWFLEVEGDQAPHLFDNDVGLAAQPSGKRRKKAAP